MNRLSFLAAGVASGLALATATEARGEPEVELVLPPSAAPEVVRAEDSTEAEPSADEPRVRVLQLVPKQGPKKRMLRGTDIRMHRLAKPRGPSQLIEHSWEPGTTSRSRSRIRYHDYRTADQSRIPYIRTNRNIVVKRWQPGARSRIRYHGYGR